MQLTYPGGITSGTGRKKYDIGMTGGTGGTLLRVNLGMTGGAVGTGLTGKPGGKLLRVNLLRTLIRKRVLLLGSVLLERGRGKGLDVENVKSVRLKLRVFGSQDGQFRKLQDLPLKFVKTLPLQKVKARVR